MINKTDYDKLQQVMNESPEKKELLTRLLDSHQMALSMISHEIRNPLTLIYSTIQFIESQHPEVLDFKYWSDIHHDLDYMILLLDELTIYNNSGNMNFKATDPVTFFRKLALSFAASIAHTNIQFISNITPILPVIQCDPVKLREVFLNLLGNARDAISDCEDSFICLSVKGNSEFLHICIEDNGCGISEEHLSHIFEPFVTYKKNGTGLGLAIAKQIITAHNGTIHVTSSCNSGTTFTLTLPVKQNS